MTITRSQRQAVQERAGGCCEYCRFPSSGGTVPFHVDHIIPLRHDGPDDLDNLCLACAKCNTYKGYNISGFDPKTEELTPLYHPRKHHWQDHFELHTDMRIEGRTPQGRTTSRVLQMNDEDRLETRQILAELGEYPCLS